MAFTKALLVSLQINDDRDIMIPLKFSSGYSRLVEDLLGQKDDGGMSPLNVLFLHECNGGSLP